MRFDTLHISVLARLHLTVAVEGRFDINWIENSVIVRNRVLSEELTIVPYCCEVEMTKNARINGFMWKILSVRIKRHIIWLLRKPDAHEYLKKTKFNLVHWELLCLVNH